MRKRTMLLGRWLFFLASIAFLIQFSRRTFASGRMTDWLDAHTLYAIAAAAMIYAVAALLAALGWRRLLVVLGHAVPAAATVAIFCITQIAKYLPGNVGHHVGRAALARSQLGVPVSTMLMSILQESAIACLAALAIAALCFALAPGAFPALSDMGFASSIGWLALPVLGTVWFVFANAQRQWLSGFSSQPMAWLVKATPTWRATAGTLPYFAVIYVLNGIAVWLVASAQVEVGSRDFLLLTGAYAVSWIAGFLLPGAPGGLGVREATLVLLLDGAYPPDIVLVLALASRLATVCADALLFAVGHIIMSVPAAR